MKPDGTLKKSIVASVSEALKADSDNNLSMDRLKEIFAILNFKWLVLLLLKRDMPLPI